MKVGILDSEASKTPKTRAIAVTIRRWTKTISRGMGRTGNLHVFADICFVSIFIFVVYIFVARVGGAVGSLFESKGASTEAPNGAYPKAFSHFDPQTWKREHAVFGIAPSYKKPELSSSLQKTMILVMSGRGNFDSRRAVRETWAKNRENVRFVVGSKWCGIPARHLSNSYPCALDPSVIGGNFTIEQLTREVENYESEQLAQERRLRAEIAEHKDIVVLDMVDSYGNLAEKTKKSVDWMARNHPKSWFFKIDDDAIANIDLVEAYLSTLKDEELRLIGSFEYNSAVLHTTKWAELRYKKAIYPPYPQGSTGYILSPGLVQTLYGNLTKLQLYRNEDASLGIWLEQLDLNNSTMVFDDNRRIRKEWKYDLGRCLQEASFFRKFTFSHEMKPNNLRLCFARLQRMEKFRNAYTQMARGIQRSQQIEGEDVVIDSSMFLNPFRENLVQSDAVRFKPGTKTPTN